METTTLSQGNDTAEITATSKDNDTTNTTSQENDTADTTTVATAMVTELASGRHPYKFVWQGLLHHIYRMLIFKMLQ